MQVRGAVLCTVGIACERFPLMMSSISCLVSPAVLSALDDSDPAVSQHVWDAALSVVKNIAVRITVCELGHFRVLSL